MICPKAWKKICLKNCTETDTRKAMQEYKKSKMDQKNHNGWNKFSLHIYSSFCLFHLQPLVPRCVLMHSILRRHTPSENTYVLLTACFYCLDLFNVNTFHWNLLHIKEKFYFLFHKNIPLIHNCTCHLIPI